MSGCFFLSSTRVLHYSIHKCTMGTSITGLSIPAGARLECVFSLTINYSRASPLEDTLSDLKKKTYCNFKSCQIKICFVNDGRSFYHNYPLLSSSVILHCERVRSIHYHTGAWKNTLEHVVNLLQKSIPLKYTRGHLSSTQNTTVPLDPAS